MLKKYSILIIILSFAHIIVGQSFNYTTSDGNLGTTYSWIDCSSGTEIQDSEWLQDVGLGDKKDDGYTEISWPFNFQFYDSYYFAGDKMYFCTNGFIRFDGVPDDDATDTYDNDISGYSPNLGEILAFGLEDAGLTDDYSTVHYLTTGSSPNRVFTIEVQNLEIRFDQAKYVDVEMSFYETSNKVVLKVGSFDVPSSYSTYLGIHSGNSSYKDQWGELQSIGENKWREYTPPAKSFNSITITQASSANVYPSDDNKLVRIQFDIDGGGGAFNFTRLAVKAVNDDNADISNVKIFHTNSSTFSTEHQVATTQTAVNSYNNYVFKNFTYNMPGGTSYIWVAYSVASGATNGNDIGAQIRKNKITIDGSKYPSSNSSNFKRTISFFEWDGSTSTDWTVGSNWSSGSVPTSSDNVIIPSAPSNQPHLPTGNNGYCKDITIKSGASLTVENSNKNLNVYGNIINDGTFSVTGSYNVLLRGTDNYIKGSGTYPTAKFRLTGSNIVYTLKDDMSIYRFDIFSGDDNCTLNINDKNLICNNRLKNSSSNSTINITTGSASVAGAVTNDGTLNNGTGTFYYSGSNSQSILNETYYNLKVKVSSGTRTLTNVATNCKSLEIVGSGTAALDNDIDIDENYTIESGCTIDMNGHSITLSGNWTNNGTLTPGSQTVTFDGIGSSHIYGSTNFYNLTLNKSTGDLYSDGTNHITNTLALTNGVLFSSSNTSVILDAGASYTGGTNVDSYVDGPMRKDGNTNFKFPIGDFRKFEPCEVLNLSANVHFVAEYTKSGHSDNTSFDAPLTKVSLNEYWNITPSAAVTADVRLYWEDGDWSGIGELNDLRLAHYNGSTWEDLSGASTSGGTTSGNITKTGVTSFSPFTFGTTDNTTNPLPIKLLSFTAKPKQKTVILNWTTASEKNNDYFIIEKSTDRNSIEKIGTISGSGNSSNSSEYELIDNNPYFGTSYYRLIQVDYDGNYEIFNWIAVTINDELKSDINIYPNPLSNGQLNIQFNNNSGKTSIRIFDFSGRIVFNKTIEIIYNDQIINLNLELPKGSYFIHFINNKNNSIKKLIIN